MQVVASAGEVSGDQILAPILRRLSQDHPMTYSGVAGPAMVEAGVYPLYPMERLSVMGLFEVLPRLPELLQMRRSLRHYLQAATPRALITCDAPDFNLPLCQAAKRLNIPAIHVVSPSVWAWRRARIPKIAAQLDALLCLFPFEPELYAETGLHTVFIGHPLASQIDFNPDPVPARSALDLLLDVPYVALLPGSRAGEVARLLPLFLAAFDQLQRDRPELRAVIPAATPALYQVVQRAVGTRPVTVVHGESRMVMAAADAVLLASGTAALESVLTGRPTVAAYQMNPWTYRLVKARLQTDYVTLPNFMAGRALIPELIQEAATPEALAHALGAALEQGADTEFLQAAEAIHASLSGPVTERAATAIGALL